MAYDSAAEQLYYSEIKNPKANYFVITLSDHNYINHEDGIAIKKHYPLVATTRIAHLKKVIAKLLQQKNMLGMKPGYSLRFSVTLDKKSPAKNERHSRFKQCLQRLKSYHDTPQPNS